MASIATARLGISHLFRGLPLIGQSLVETGVSVAIVRTNPADVIWPIPRSAGARVVALVPGEHVSLMAVDLPAARRRDRLAALPWAIEDMVIEPFSQLHLVLGPEISPRRHLVAVVRHRVMREWRDILRAAGLARCPMIPDVLALPVASPGCWSVLVDRQRVLVRGDGETAFAVDAPLFREAWTSGGSPPLELHGDENLPDQPAGGIGPLTAADPHPFVRAAPLLSRPPLDLAQGPYAPEGEAGFTAASRTATIALAGALATFLLYAADTAALVRLADHRAAEAARLEAGILPPARISGDVAADLASVARVANAPHSLFLPLLDKASAALRPFAGQMSIRSLAFSAEDRSLTMTIGVRDFAALQSVEQALSGAALVLETGAAAAAAGGVEAKVKLRDGESR